MKITKPIIFFDLESTGLDTSNDRIMQFAAIKFNTDGTKRKLNVQINPDHPISDHAFEKTGMTLEMLKDKPLFEEVVEQIFEFMRGCDIGGYNVLGYDIALLFNEFYRYGYVWDLDDMNVIDSYQLEIALTSKTLENVYKKYTGLELVDAHDALSDVKADIKILEKQMELIPKEDDDIVKNVYTFLKIDKTKIFDLAGKVYVNDNQIPCWNFGKNKGLPLAENPGYIKWVLSTDFPPETKLKIVKYLESVK